MGEMLLTIQHDKKLISPPVLDEVKLEWERTGSPGKLTFTTAKISGKSFTEGDAVCFYYNNKKIFMGYVFTKRLDKTNQIEVTCYDQIRYLKNKYTYVFEKKTATQVVKALCKNYNLHVGKMDDTKYKIPAIAEEDKAALDIILSALEETLLNTGNQYVLYDDFGELILKNSANMVSNTLIFKDTAEDFEYTSSIDEDVYNSIVLYYKPDSSGSKSNSATSGATKVIQVAAAEIGNAESPLGSDNQKYGVEYGLNYAAWCCIFVWWVFKHAGVSNLLYGGNKIAGCTPLMNWFQSKGQFHTSNPQPGDCVFFTWCGNNSLAEHVGIVESVKSNGEVICIEGNCSDSVRRLSRSSGIIGYGRPAYPTTSTETASTFATRNAPSGGSSESTNTTTSNTTKQSDAAEKVQVFTAMDKDKIKEWGTLRYFEKIDTPAIGKSKAKQLLKLYCRKKRELKITGAFGDTNVRGGTLIPVKLNVGDKDIKNYMLVEKVTHNFSNDYHTMDLTLEGAWGD